MILPILDATLQQETYKRKNETRDWPKVVFQDSSGARREVTHVSFDDVLNQIVLVSDEGHETERSCDGGTGDAGSPG